MASGKTVVGEALAHRLGYGFLDTGLMYRAVTRAALGQNLSLQDGQALSALAKKTTVKGSSRARAGMRIIVDGQDVTDELRSPEVDNNVSVVSQVAGVRQALVQRQRGFAGKRDIVMVGRDIGSVVLPKATLKVFITASPQERARRRFLEAREGDTTLSYAKVVQDIARRDKLDSERAISPLKPAQDAVVLDTEGLSVEQVVEHIVLELRKRVANG